MAYEITSFYVIFLKIITNILYEENFNFDGEWKEIGKGVSVPDFSGQYFIITGSGKYFQNIKDNPEDSICIVTVDETGKNYKVVWGLVNGGRPTSEISAHLLTHSINQRRQEENTSSISFASEIYKYF